MRAGAARVVITPPLGSSMPGGWGDRRAAAVHDDLHAHALVLEQAGTRVALVSCDVICMPADVTAAARHRIALRCAIPPDHVLIAATHTPTGGCPADLLGTPRDAAYAAWLPQKIADAVDLAAQRLRPAGVAAARGHEDRVSFNRRYWMRNGTVRMNPGYANPDVVRPAGPIDPEVGMLFVAGADGAPIGVVLSFALHFVGTDTLDAFSADYFGHVSWQLQLAFGPEFVTVFFNGASGDVNRIDVNAPPFRAGDEYAGRVARAIAGSVLRETALLQPRRDAPLAARTVRVPFWRRAVTPGDVALARAILAAPADAPPPSPYVPGPFGWVVVGHPIPRNLWRLFAQETIRLAALPEAMETEVQVVRVGEAAVVGLPGEIFCALGLALKARSPRSPVLIAELANEYLGYVPTARAIQEEGGYETWAALSALPTAGTGEALVDAAVALLQQMD
jgi:hypothetical protein